MNYLFVVPTIASLFYCLAKFLERKYLVDSNEFEKLSLKYIARDAIIIFSITLFANFIYFNTHHHLDNFFSIITDTNGTDLKTSTEIFTDHPNF